MAVALRQQTRTEVLLLDADVGVGNVTSVLDVPYRHGLADLADSPPEEWTDAAFEQCVSVHAASGVRVLTWGTDPAESERVSVDLLLAALRWGRNHHSYVIIDNHPGYDDRTMAMLAVANEIILVVTPEVGALRNSAQFLELARELGLGDNIRVVVNRANHGIRSAGHGLVARAADLRHRHQQRAEGGHRLERGQPGRLEVPQGEDLRRPASGRPPDLIAGLVAAPATPQRSASRWWTRFGTRTSQA